MPLFAIVAALLLSACSGMHSYKYKVGVSQCVGGKWREKVNDEMLSAQHLYGNEVKVSIKNANDDSRLQAKQIDSLVASGVDLVVVAPNDMTIAPAIARAREKGVPVVFFDRKVNSDDYTAYIGGDNVEAGRVMGRYALSLLRERVSDRVPRVLELTGGTSSSPAIDRHKGFASAMRGRKDIDYSFVNTDWSTEFTYKAMADWLERHPVPDVVFCHSDLAASAAYKAASDKGVAGKIMFLGIDGLPGKGEGIEAVEKGMLAGTYIYPTHGEDIVRLALDILQGKKFRRENIMKSGDALQRPADTANQHGDAQTEPRPAHIARPARKLFRPLQHAAHHNHSERHGCGIAHNSNRARMAHGGHHEEDKPAGEEDKP